MYEYLTDLLTNSFEATAAVQTSSRLEDLGLESLALAELVDVLQESLRVPVENDELSLAMTVQDLADLLERKGATVPC